MDERRDVFGLAGMMFEIAISNALKARQKERASNRDISPAQP